MVGDPSLAVGAETGNVPEAAVHPVAIERGDGMSGDEVMRAPVRINLIARGRTLLLKTLSSLLLMKRIHVRGFLACQKTLPSER